MAGGTPIGRIWIENTTIHEQERVYTCVVPLKSRTEAPGMSVDFNTPADAISIINPLRDGVDRTIMWMQLGDLYPDFSFKRIVIKFIARCDIGVLHAQRPPPMNDTNGFRGWLNYPYWGGQYPGDSIDLDGPVTGNGVPRELIVEIGGTHTSDVHDPHAAVNAALAGVNQGATFRMDVPVYDTSLDFWFISGSCSMEESRFAQFRNGNNANSGLSGGGSYEPELMDRSNPLIPETDPADGFSELRTVSSMRANCMAYPETNHPNDLIPGLCPSYWMNVFFEVGHDNRFVEFALVWGQDFVTKNTASLANDSGVRENPRFDAMSTQMPFGENRGGVKITITGPKVQVYNHNMCVPNIDRASNPNGPGEETVCTIWYPGETISGTRRNIGDDGYRMGHSQWMKGCLYFNEDLVNHPESPIEVTTRKAVFLEEMNTTIDDNFPPLWVSTIDAMPACKCNSVAAKGWTDNQASFLGNGCVVPRPGDPRHEWPASSWISNDETALRRSKHIEFNDKQKFHDKRNQYDSGNGNTGQYHSNYTIRPRSNEPSDPGGGFHIIVWDRVATDNCNLRYLHLSALNELQRWYWWVENGGFPVHYFNSRNTVEGDGIPLPPAKRFTAMVHFNGQQFYVAGQLPGAIHWRDYLGKIRLTAPDRTFKAPGVADGRGGTTFYTGFATSHYGAGLMPLAATLTGDIVMRKHMLPTAVTNWFANMTEKEDPIIDQVGPSHYNWLLVRGNGRSGRLAGILYSITGIHDILRAYLRQTVILAYSPLSSFPTAPEGKRAEGYSWETRPELRHPAQVVADVTWYTGGAGGGPFDSKGPRGDHRGLTTGGAEGSRAQTVWLNGLIGWGWFTVWQLLDEATRNYGFQGTLKSSELQAEWDEFRDQFREIVRFMCRTYVIYGATINELLPSHQAADTVWPVDTEECLIPQDRDHRWNQGHTLDFPNVPPGSNQIPHNHELTLRPIPKRGPIDGASDPNAVDYIQAWAYGPNGSWSFHNQMTHMPFQTFSGQFRESFATMFGALRVHQALGLDPDVYDRARFYLFDLNSTNPTRVIPFLHRFGDRTDEQQARGWGWGKTYNENAAAYFGCTPDILVDPGTGDEIRLMSTTSVRITGEGELNQPLSGTTTVSIRGVGFDTNSIIVQAFQPVPEGVDPKPLDPQNAIFNIRGAGFDNPIIFNTGPIEITGTMATVIAGTGTPIIVNEPVDIEISGSLITYIRGADFNIPIVVQTRQHPVATEIVFYVDAIDVISFDISEVEMPVSNLDFELPAGNHWTLKLLVYDVTHQPINVRPASSITWVMKRNVSDRSSPLVAKTLANGISIEALPNESVENVIVVELTREDTLSLSDRFYHECAMTLEDRYLTVGSGSVEIILTALPPSDDPNVTFGDVGDPTPRNPPPGNPGGEIAGLSSLIGR